MHFSLPRVLFILYIHLIYTLKKGQEVKHILFSFSSNFFRQLKLKRTDNDHGVYGGETAGMKLLPENKSETITKSSNDVIKYKKRTTKRREMLLGLGFWMQGFRCFPWTAVIFFLKDGLRLDPSTMQILQNSANLPMVAKPVYGLISDSFYLFGQHRVPYIAIGALLQAISWFAMASLPSSTISFFKISICLLVGNLGASIVEVANDAIVAECGDLQSFGWVAGSIGGVLGNLSGGISINHFSPQTMFLFFCVLLTLQFFITISVGEKSLNLPKKQYSIIHHGIKSQFSDLLLVLKNPEIYRPILWFSTSYAIIPTLTSTMFFYQTQELKMESSFLGISKVLGQVGMLLWGVVYNRHLKSTPPRKLISAIQGTMAVLMVSDALFVNGFYRRMGIHDSVYVMLVSSFLEVLYFFKILPFSVLMGKLCPAGCEGSLMAFVMSSISLAFIVSGYLGVALAASYVETDFSGLGKGLLIQAACTVLPLFWSWFIPDIPEIETEAEKKER